MIRVVIADDHALIREGLRKVFSREADIEVVGEAQNVREALDTLREQVPDVLILDINMPDRSGLEALPQIARRRPDMPVLILSMMAEDQVAVRMLRAGAAGFVSKESAAEEIADAVRRVASGRRYVSPAVADELAAELLNPAASTPHDALSDREFQVLRMIASGRKTSAIAEELALSVNTIATYRRRIRDKLDLQSDVEIARYAVDNRLLD